MLVTNPLAPRSWSRQLVRSVSSGWWVLLLSGIVSIVAGGIILLVDWSVNDLAIFLGVLFIVRGVFNMMSLPLDGSARATADLDGSFGQACDLPDLAAARSFLPRLRHKRPKRPKSPMSVLIRDRQADPSS